MADKRIRVLHVDDVEAEFILLREMLSTVQGIDFEFRWASDIQTATQTIYTTDFDVCLVDYYLGIDNGLDFIKMLIEKGVTIPFILMSGQRDSSVNQEALKIGVRQCINKDDISAPTLHKAIQNAVSSSR